MSDRAVLISGSPKPSSDVRTLVSFAPEIKTAADFEGIPHNPVDDCLHQIKYCSKIWNTLKIS